MFFWPCIIEFTFQNNNLVHNSFNIQQYICYITLFNMFRAAGPIVSPQPLVSSLFTNSRTEGDDTRGCGDTIGPPDDEQRAARNMLRSVM